MGTMACLTRYPRCWSPLFLGSIGLLVGGRSRTDGWFFFRRLVHAARVRAELDHHKGQISIVAEGFQQRAMSCFTSGSPDSWLVGTYGRTAPPPDVVVRLNMSPGLYEERNSGRGRRNLRLDSAPRERRQLMLRHAEQVLVKTTEAMLAHNPGIDLLEIDADDLDSAQASLRRRATDVLGL